MTPHMRILTWTLIFILRFVSISAFIHICLKMKYNFVFWSRRNVSHYHQQSFLGLHTNLDDHISQTYIDTLSH